MSFFLETNKQTKHWRTAAFVFVLYYLVSCLYPSMKLFTKTRFLLFFSSSKHLTKGLILFKLEPPCITVHSVVHIIQAALMFLNLSKFKWVAVFLLRLVHTLWSDQMFGSTLLLNMANVSIESVDPHRTLVDQPNFQLYTLCTHV